MEPRPSDGGRRIWEGIDIMTTTRQFSRPFAPGLVFALAASIALATGPASADGTLNIYNWSDYIAEDTIANFEAETGIDVTYDVFDSNEVLEGKLLAGNTGYDIVVPSGSFLERQIQAGVFQALDQSALSNYGNLDAAILERVAAHDAGNAHAVPYMWGTTGIGYNVAMVEERMGDAPVNSWDLILNPEILSKFSDCGVTVLDAPTELLDIALNYLGYDPGAGRGEGLDEAEELLQQIRPHLKYFHSSQYINDLANGDICIAVGWSGDVLIAADRAAEADNGVEIAYSIPEEGTVIWFDLLAIPSDAGNVAEAHLFLDYLMRPEVMADITNYVYYANGNAAAAPFVEAEILEDPGIYPPDEVMAKLFADTADTPRVTRMQNRIWTRIKTGT